jgi:hypothetical protein
MIMMMIIIIIIINHQRLFFFCVILNQNIVVHLDLNRLMLTSVVSCLAHCLLITTLRMTDIIDSALLNNLRSNWYSTNPNQIWNKTQHDNLRPPPHCSSLHVTPPIATISTNRWPASSQLLGNVGGRVLLLIGRRGGGCCCPLHRPDSLQGVCGSVWLERVGWWQL